MPVAVSLTVLGVDLLSIGVNFHNTVNHQLDAKIRHQLVGDLEFFNRFH
jgi:hypothetical protein